MRKLPAALAVVGLAVVCLGLASCGGGSGGKEGGTLTGSYASFPDYLDPALSYTAEGWTAMYDTYIPLLTYAHANGAAGAKVVPALAESLPKISNGGKTYTLTLRKGLKYSDGTPVKASDFASTVERIFKLNSPGSPFYTGIVGAEEFAETKSGGIPGIKTDDKTGEIVDRPDRAARHLHQRAGAAVRRARPARHAGQEPDRRPAPGHRPLRDRQVRTGPRLVLRAQPAVGEEQRRADARPAQRPRRQDRDLDRPQRLDPGQRHRTGQDRLDADLVPADLYSKVKDKYEGTQFRVEHPINLYYFWMNTTQAAVRRPQGAPGGQLRGRHRGAGTDLRRLAGRDPPDPARGHARPREVRPLPARHGQGRRR